MWNSGSCRIPGEAPDGKRRHSPALFSACLFPAARSTHSKLRSRWEQILRDTPEALLHLDSIDLGLFVPSTKGFRKVLNHHNCESAMALRRAQREPNRLKKAFLALQARELRRMEKSICADFDNNLVVSEEDASQLRAIQPRAHFSVVENGVDTSYFQPAQEQEESNTLAFTGLLDWYPNVSGIRFFVREIWPLVKARFADARLYLAGKNPAEEVLACTKADSSIVVIPNPDDMRPMLAARVRFASARFLRAEAPGSKFWTRWPWASPS